MIVKVVINVEDGESIGCLASIPLSWQHLDDPLSTVERPWQFVKSHHSVPLITAKFQHDSDRPVRLQTQQSIINHNRFHFSGHFADVGCGRSSMNSAVGVLH